MWHYGSKWGSIVGQYGRVGKRVIEQASKIKRLGVYIPWHGTCYMYITRAR